MVLVPVSSSSRSQPNALDDAESSSASRYTPSSASVNSDDVGYDPDTPLPSIESVATPASTHISHISQRSHSATTTQDWTPAVSSGSTDDGLTQGLQDIRLSSSSTTNQSSARSPATPVHIRRVSSTSLPPHVHVTPPPTIQSSSASIQQRTPSSSITPSSTVAALNLGDLDINADSRPSSSARDERRLSAALTEGTRSPDAGRRPSPHRRRRSSSVGPRAPHTVEDEEPPETRFFERRTQEALSRAKVLTSELVSTLSSSVLHREQGSRVSELYRQATALHAFQPHSTRIIGLVGDSGVGKSKLINSLLDTRDLARSSSSGAACTCVVTEYHYHDRDDFILEINYFSADELINQFGELLHAYQAYHRPSEGESRQDRQELERRAKLAKDTFRAAFRDRFLRNESILLQTPDTALNTMRNWTRELLPQSNNAQNRETYDDLSQCSERLVQLTSETGSENLASIWPFIRRIKLSLKAYILSKGLILADLPGLRDLNSARQNVTERYIRSCHEIFAVCNVARATTDAGVKEVFNLARRANLSNIGIVCTRSDDIDATEAQRDWPQQRLRISDLQDQVRETVREIASLKDDITELENLEADEPLSAEDEEDLKDLNRRLRRAEKAKSNHEFQLWKHLIETRNAKVISALQTLYRDHPAAANLKTFCVSNTIYWENRDEPVDKSLPFLRLSNIMELRKHCLAIVAESNLRQTVEYIQRQIPALLQSVELWVQAGIGGATAERKQQILDVTNRIQRQLEDLTSPDSAVDAAIRLLTVSFRTEIVLYMRQHVPQWSESALYQSEDWEGWHHASYSAFCRNYGDHHTGVIGSRCWNEEIMAHMTSDMNPLWEANLFHALSRHIRTTKVNVSSKFDGIFEICRHARTSESSEDQRRSPLTVLHISMEHRKAITMRGLENLVDKFYQSLNKLQTDAFSGLRSSIIGELMEDTYRTCNRESGTGSHARRKAHMRRRIASPALFTDHLRVLRSRFEAFCTTLQTDIQELLDEQLELVFNDLDTLRSENAVLECERFPEFRERVGRETERMKGVLEELERELGDPVGSRRLGWDRDGDGDVHMEETVREV